ncbi:hypothetical protein F8388_015187 [Cannabis sativa]|uniref:UBX domain-containing protein n=1 Tax=Cannabis sativa TaxID=3483 RepID=A0A7J6HJJ0_CANSA|nr:hypothetical protein F8388_015187 [Cannabis sativa]KAF4395433.1 hypothetical protein G4B88_010897 [Cannabis sativa]
MDDVKDKVKGFMKKVNSSISSSSSGKFKGQGRVLGSSSTSSSSTPSNPIPSRLLNTPQSGSGSNSNSNSKPLPPKTQISNPKPDPSPQKPKTSNGFDPFESLVTSGKRCRNGFSPQVFKCPICDQVYGSEEEVSEHVDTCVNGGESGNTALESGSVDIGIDSSRNELEARVGGFLSAKPSAGSIEIILKLLKNIVKEPENAKFRKIRMGNPKIREAIGDVVGGVELLEAVGFSLKEEDGEMWASMEVVPLEDGIGLIKYAVNLLEPPKEEQQKMTSSSSVDSGNLEEKVEPKKIDRQTKVFFSVSENLAAKIELPDSFYKMSIEEVRREAEMRRKKLADSQLLIPRSLKEKQAKAARKRYTKTVIRVQFPDGVVLQAIFSPFEPTSSLYEFVSSALKEPSLEFHLLNPVNIKRRVIPCFPTEGGKQTTLEEEDLVPSALIKFRPSETDSVVFTGLRNELLEISEPLLPDSAVSST